MTAAGGFEPEGSVTVFVDLGEEDPLAVG